MAQLNVTEKVLIADTDNVFKIFDDDDVSNDLSRVKQTPPYIQSI